MRAPSPVLRRSDSSTTPRSVPGDRSPAVPPSLNNFDMSSQGSQQGRVVAHPWSRAVFDALKFYARDLMRALGITRGLSAAAVKALRRVWTDLEDPDRISILADRKDPRTLLPLLSPEVKAGLTSRVSMLLETKLRELCREAFPQAAALSAALHRSDACTLEEMMQHAEARCSGIDDRYARARTGSVSESSARATEPEGAVRRSSRKRKRPVSAADNEFVEVEAVASCHSGSGSEGDSGSEYHSDRDSDGEGPVFDSDESQDS